jgi:hypothetical protein
MSRKQVRDSKQKHGLMKTAGKFLGERLLARGASMVYSMAQPLRQTYNYFLDEHKQGPEKQIKCQAKVVTGELLALEMEGLANNLYARDILTKCGFSCAHYGNMPYVNHRASAPDTALGIQFRLSERYFDLHVCAMSQRHWSQFSLQVCLPESLPGIFCPIRDIVIAHMVQIKEIVLALEKAQEMTMNSDDDHLQSLKACLKDVWWWGEKLGKRYATMLKQANFNPKDALLISEVFGANTGLMNTKSPLEAILFEATLSNFVCCL